MRYVTPEEIQRAREIDAFSYLQTYCPGELVKLGKEIIDIMAGNFLIVNAPLESEHYESLSFGQLQKYRKKFENPEHFVRINGEITAIPYKAEKEKNHRGDGR